MCIPKMLDSPEMLSAISSPETEAADSGLKYLVRLVVKCSCLEVLTCCLSKTR